MSMSTATVLDVERIEEARYLLSVEYLIKIRQESLFSMLPMKAARRILRDHCRVDHVHAGRDIQRGRPRDEIVIVANGVVGFRGQRGQDDVAAVFGPGKSLELAATIGGRDTWTYDWIAQTDAAVMRLEASAFFDALKAEGRYEYLRRVVDSEAAWKLVKSLKLLGFTQDDVNSTIVSLQDANGPELVDVFRDGVLGLIERGDLLVRGALEGDVKDLGYFSVGQFFVVDRSLEVEFDVQPSPDLKVRFLPIERWQEISRPELVRSFTTFHDGVAATIGGIRRVTSNEAATTRRLPEEVDDGLTFDDFKVDEAEAARLAGMKRYNFKQFETIDCGAASLSSVCRFYGKKISIGDIRRLVDVGKDGASMLGMVKGARDLGFDASGFYAQRLRSYEGIRMPFIAVCNYHYVIVYAFDDKEVTVGDPALSSVIKMPREKFQSEFSGNVLLLRPSQAFFDRQDSEANWKKYLDIFAGERGAFSTIVMLAFVSFILGLANPLLQQVIYDGMVAKPDFGAVKAFAVALLTLSTINQIVGHLQSYFTMYFTGRIDARFSALFLRHLYSLPLGYFAVRRAGDVLMRMDQLTKIRSFFSSKPISLFFRLLSVVVYSAVLFVYSPMLLGMVVVVLPPLLWFTRFMTPKLVANSEAGLRMSALESNMSMEQIKFVEAVKSINGQISARWRWNSVMIDRFKNEMEALRLHGMFSIVSSLVQNVLSQALFFVSIMLFMNDELSFGQVMAVTALAGQVIGPVMSLLDEWEKFNQAAVSFARVDDIVTARSEHAPDGDELLGVGAIKGHITFERVTFQYGGVHSQIVLDDVNLEIHPGERLALVGRSGSGKSSLAYLINGLYQPVDGKVLVDGMPLTELNLSDLRRRIAFVMQDNTLFRGTILENICLGDPTPNFERAARAAELADAAGFIAGLKNGYYTMLGEGGEGLSGGQRQRINIARAVYLDPSVLVMDEATSALDAISETAIIRNLRELNKKMTVVVIAHRLNTVMSCDRIVVMDMGRVAEVGTHETLMTRQGLYYELFRRQTTV